jgi:hypothetical protein
MFLSVEHYKFINLCVRYCTVSSEKKTYTCGASDACWLWPLLPDHTGCQEQPAACILTGAALRDDA